MKQHALSLLCVVLGAVLGSLGLSLLQGQGTKPVAVPRELTSYRDVVKKVLPAVVSVEARTREAAAARRPADMAGVPDFGTDDNDPNRVGFGSGFLISPKGVIVTNNHVVRDADFVVIQFKDGKKAISKKVYTDPKTDLAIVLLDDKNDLPYLEWGNSDDMEIGDRVLAVGAPFGLTGTVTHGIISSVGRSLRLNLYEDFLQTDAAINPGNSGGPLVDLRGQVIGINSAIKSRSGGFQGIGLAISSNLGKKVVSALLRDGTVKRGYLGASILDLTEDDAKRLRLPDTSGAIVTSIAPDSPADRAGLKKGDVLRSLAGKPLADGKALQDIVASLPLDKEVDLDILRDGRPQTVKVTIREQPATFGTARTGVPNVDRDGVSIESVGMVLYDLTPELARLLKYPEASRGAVILRMKRTGIAGNAGLTPGTLITAVNGQPIRSTDDAVNAFKAGSLDSGIVVDYRGPRTAMRRVVLKSG